MAYLLTSSLWNKSIRDKLAQCHLQFIHLVICSSSEYVTTFIDVPCDGYAWCHPHMNLSNQYNDFKWFFRLQYHSLSLSLFVCGFVINIINFHHSSILIEGYTTLILYDWSFLARSMGNVLRLRLPNLTVCRGLRTSRLWEVHCYISSALLFWPVSVHGEENDSPSQ